MKVYIGLDEREVVAAHVSAKTLFEQSRIVPELLCIDRLRMRGLMTRIMDRRGEARAYDLISNAHTSTDFAISRFLVPILCQEGFALFVDGDTVFMRNPMSMLHTAFERYAVSVVKHAHVPAETRKMDGQPQAAYPRKNWSSVMLFNCDHPANRRLTLHDVNTRPGLWLHQFGWLADDEIGDLEPAWNWLVDVQPRPEHVGIAHMTLGGPFVTGWKGGGSFDDEWLSHAR